MAATPRLALLVVVVSLLVPFALKSAAGADTVSDKRAQASRLAAQLSALAERSSSLAEAFDQARLHVNDVNTKLAAAKAQLAATTGQLSDAQKRVKDMAVLSYMQGGAASQLSILIPSSVSEIGLRNAYVSSVTGNTNDAVDSLHATKTELSRLQNQLAAAQTAANNAVAQVQADQRSVAASDARTAAAYAQAQAQLGQAVLDQARHQQAAVIQARITATPPSRGIGIQINPFSQPPPPPGVGAGEAIAWAKAEIGKPYEYGGGGPDNFDCSGLTAWAWGHAGTPLPHSSESQYYDTTHVTVAELQPGDLVFFGMPPHHVGLYVGGGQMINALHSGTNVEYDSIYMEGDLIGGGRVN